MMRRLSIAASTAMLITACSSGSQGIVPSQSPPRYPATFVMHWPALSPRTSSRRPHFISPSTQSIAIEVNDDPKLTTIADNPSTGQPATSHVTVMAPPGNDVITFSLYDHTGATGNELGQVTVTQKIVGGQNNTINATIDGIVTSIELDPLPNQPTISSTKDSSGTVNYTIAGDFAITFAAKSKDADGNIILTSGTPVSYSVTSTTDTLAVTPVSGQSNQFSVRVANLSQEGRANGLVAHATDELGNIAQTNYPVNVASLTYVAYQNNGTAKIVALDATGKAIALPGTFGGITQPSSLAYDFGNHRIYALDKATSKVLAFNSDGTPAGGFSSPTVSGATAVAFDYHDNQLYVTSSSNTVSVFNADGSPVTVAGTWPNLAGPVGISFFDGNPLLIVVADATNNTFSTYNEDGTASTQRPWNSFSTGTLQPTGITTDGIAGSITLSGTDSGTGELALFNKNGSLIFTQNAGLSTPIGVFFDLTNADYYVANSSTDSLAVYDEAIAGLLSTITPPAGLSKPVAVTFVI